MASMDSKSKMRLRTTNNASDSEDDERGIRGRRSPSPLPPSDGLPQTGPKGVLSDYQRYREEEIRAKFREERKKRQLIKDTAATVKPKSEEERDQVDGTNSQTNLIETLEKLDVAEDPFLQQYRAQRIQQMKEQAKAGKKRKMFGNLIELRGDKYASAIDSAPADAFVVIHIYDDFFISCVKMNHCLTDLAKMYPTVKFCRIQTFQLDLSKDFLEKGLPALLVYKGGEMIGNLLRVTDTLGEKFNTGKVEEFLLDQHCLPTEEEAKVLNVFNLSPRPSETAAASGTDDDDDDN